MQGAGAQSDNPIMGQMLLDVSYFSKRVTEEVARARRSGTQFSVVIFRSQPRGDELPEMACVEALPAVLANVRDTDTVCRISHDSIAVLLIDSDGEGSRKAALRLMDRMGADLSRWSVSILEYPACTSILDDLGLAA